MSELDDARHFLLDSFKLLGQKKTPNGLSHVSRRRLERKLRQLFHLMRKEIVAPCNLHLSWHLYSNADGPSYWLLTVS